VPISLDGKPELAANRTKLYERDVAEFRAAET
jgi:hypothetical protein